MGNTVPGVATKLLTLVPILVAVYYFDFPKFETIFTSSSLLPFFIVTVSLFVFGVALKRKILAVRMELSKASFAWGLLLLAAAVTLYVYGSYSPQAVWFHYESLYVLIVAYVAFRIGPGVLRAMAPLLAILAFSFLPISFYPDLLHRELLAFLSADLIAMSFLIFVRLHAKSAVFPIVAVTFGVAAWFDFALSFPIRTLYLDLLIPFPFVLLAVPRIRRFASLPSGRPSVACLEHHILPDGFCSICGLKLARADVGENFGLWGLMAVLGIAALIILTSIPILALMGGVPYDSHYTSGGFSGTITPSTPPGWQINSTEPENVQGDIYAINQVYVPTYHPETENYSMYYELSFIEPPTSSGPFGIDLPGYNRTLDELVQFGPFQGDLNGYLAPGQVFLAYHGTTSMVFLDDGTADGIYVGLGFTRDFHNSNLTADTAQFLADLNALWLPKINADVSLSGWTAFVYNLDRGVQSIGQFALTALSVGVLGFGAFSVSASDEHADEFLTRSYVQPDEYWRCLGRLMRRPHYQATGQELSSGPGSSDLEGTAHLDSTLRELERRQLVKRSLIERGAEIISVWRAAV